MDEREEGEVSDGTDDGFDLAYKPVARPSAPQYRSVAKHLGAPQYRSVAKHLGSSDEDYSSDSDSDGIVVKKKRPSAAKMDTATVPNNTYKGWPPESNQAMQAFLKPRRRNNVWSTVMEEQVLEQEIGGFGLKRRLDQGDRSIESYDYRHARKVRDNLPTDSEEETEESEDLVKKRLNRKRHFKDRLNYTKSMDDDHPRELVELNLTEEMTHEEIGKAMAEALSEEKHEIIIRTVETLGRERSLALYKETQELERKGGLMVLDGSRRRTPGGVFLQLLKKLPGIDKPDLNKIFFVQEEQWRKRKRAHRRRERHESKPQGEDGTEEGLHLRGLFSDDPGGAKCPGSTPVTSPQPSDTEDDLPSSTINQLSPSVLPDQLPTPPPSVADPRALKPEALEAFNGDAVQIQDPRALTIQSYEGDDDFLLETHPADAMELF